MLYGFAIHGIFQECNPNEWQGLAVFNEGWEPPVCSVCNSGFVRDCSLSQCLHY